MLKSILLTCLTLLATGTVMAADRISDPANMFDITAGGQNYTAQIIIDSSPPPGSMYTVCFEWKSSSNPDVWSNIGNNAFCPAGNGTHPVSISLAMWPPGTLENGRVRLVRVSTGATIDTKTG